MRVRGVATVQSGVGEESAAVPTRDVLRRLETAECRCPHPQVLRSVATHVRRTMYCFFFFSSRRRHTRFDCDWSSDVCSSDLGYRMVWSGRFEDQQRALARLYVIVPLVIFIIFILLFGAFQSIGDALLIMLNLPFALIGGTLALFLWRTTFNISAAVGFVAVFGVSVLNGVVLVSSIRQARAEGLGARDAVLRGCALRFRPIVVSGIVAVIGFIPAAISHGIGSEIQRPLARVVIGGLVSSTALTLLVLPVVYALIAGWSGPDPAPEAAP